MFILCPFTKKGVVQMKKIYTIYLLMGSNLLFSNTCLANTTTQVSQTSEITTQSSSSEKKESMGTISAQQAETVVSNETNKIPHNKDSIQEEIIISDPILKKIILSNLGLPENSPVTKESMERLTSLYLPSSSASELSSLAGLEYATNLVDFNIMGTNQVTDFSPLENLTKLKYVRLQSSNVTSDNFPDLSKNKEIFLVSLSDTSVDNRVMDKLANLTSIDSISFQSNMNITDISPLKVLPNLTSLGIQFCGVTDFTVINEFPALNSLAAFGQNTGRNDAATQLNSNTLNYQKENQILFIPFSIMPNRMTNFDGYVPPFTTSNGENETILSLNEKVINPDRLQITEEGLTILGMTEKEFNDLESISYNALLNNPTGSYAQPNNFVFYSISSGTYLHNFIVIHGPKFGAPVTVHYLDTDGNPLAESETLTGNLDDPFKSQPAIINGWHVKEAPINAEGVFTTETQEIVYIYERSTASPVTIQYMNEKGEVIHEPLIIKGPIGESFDTNTPDYQLNIEGYTLNKEKLPKNMTGIFSEAAQTVTYYYKSTSLDSTPGNQKSENNNGKNTIIKSTDTKITSKKLPKTGEKSPTLSTLIGIGILITIILFTSQKIKKNQYNR